MLQDPYTIDRFRELCDQLCDDLEIARAVGTTVEEMHETIKESKKIRDIYEAKKQWVLHHVKDHAIKQIPWEDIPYLAVHSVEFFERAMNKFGDEIERVYEEGLRKGKAEIRKRLYENAVNCQSDKGQLYSLERMTEYVLGPMQSKRSGDVEINFNEVPEDIKDRMKDDFTKQG